MVAYNFPPEGNAGAYRPLRFVRHIPALGWRPTVITLATDVYERYDPDLLKAVPVETEVVRVRNPDPWNALQEWRTKRLQKTLSVSPTETVLKIQANHQAPIRTFLRKTLQTMETWVYHPDKATGWIQPAVKSIVKLCEYSKPDVVWASGPPWSSFIVAGRSSQRTNIPFVLDFRDSWTMTYTDFETRRPAWAKQLDKRTLRQLLAEAQAVILRSDTEAECFLRAYNGALEASKIHIIPNGYEGTIEERPAPKGDKCKILYAGSLSDYRWDSLLHAVRSLKRFHTELANHLHLQFVGENTESLANEAATLGIADVVSTAGPMSHEEITRLSQKAHALLILERSATMMGHELLAGAKLFGYLKAGRPIIGVLPPGEASNILRCVGVSTVAHVDSPTEIVGVLRQVLEAWSNETLSRFNPDRAACEVYSAERQTAALIRALEGVEAAEPFIPGSVEIPASLREEIGHGNWIKRSFKLSGLMKEFLGNSRSV